MANRSYLYSVDKIPETNNSSTRIIGLSECNYNIPLVYRILCSVNPNPTRSIIWDADEKIAITADYLGGMEIFEKFITRIQDYVDNNILNNVRAFLNNKNNVQKYIHLECGEIFEMEDGELGLQNLSLINELGSLDEEIKYTITNLKENKENEVQAIGLDYWDNCLYYNFNK